MDMSATVSAFKEKEGRRQIVVIYRIASIHENLQHPDITNKMCL